MARYDTQRAWFRTPRGKSALMYIREGTNDWNTVNASMTEDEYHLADLDPEGIAVDAGGYLGSVAIGLLIDHPRLGVICIEPLPENADLIERNAEVNGVRSRLLLKRAAIGDGQPLTVAYAYEGDENDRHHAFVGNSTITGDTAGVHRSVTVPTLTPHDFGVVDLLKIDAEGGEWAFFASGPTYRFRHIVGEWHPVGGHTREDLVALLPDHDITFSGPEGGPGEFVATIRPDAGGS